MNALPPFTSYAQQKYMSMYQQAVLSAAYYTLGSPTRRGSTETSLVFAPACSSVCVTQDGKLWSNGKVAEPGGGAISFEGAMIKWCATTRRPGSATHRPPLAPKRALPATPAPVPFRASSAQVRRRIQGDARRELHGIQLRAVRPGVPAVPGLKCAAASRRTPTLSTPGQSPRHRARAIAHRSPGRSPPGAAETTVSAEQGWEEQALGEKQRSELAMAHVNKVVLALVVLLVTAFMVVRVRRTRLCDVDGRVHEIILQERVRNPVRPPGQAEYGTLSGRKSPSRVSWSESVKGGCVAPGRAPLGRHRPFVWDCCIKSRPVHLCCCAVPPQGC